MYNSCVYPVIAHSRIMDGDCIDPRILNMQPNSTGIQVSPPEIVLHKGYETHVFSALPDVYVPRARLFTQFGERDSSAGDASGINCRDRHPEPILVMSIYGQCACMYVSSLARRHRR